jgi:farnesyl diphosphate synthase
MDSKEMASSSLALHAAAQTEASRQDFAAWMQTKQARTEFVLDQLLPAAALAPQRLHSAMRYSILGGGKRVRALLCYAAAELYPSTNQADVSLADVAASAVELIHAYSLVHDDMPCMDDDDLRRGKASCHRQYDDATALLVGDALQSLAFAVLSQPGLCAQTQTQLAMLNILALATGSTGMAGGQAIDLASVGKALTQAELEMMHNLKTGALIQAAVLLGNASGQGLANDDYDKTAALDVYAANIGLAFQVVDDILDVEADTSTLGKTAGKDADSNKPTYVSILGLAPAKQHAQQLYTAALAALSPFGDQAKRLRQLADFIMQRSF